MNTRPFNPVSLLKTPEEIEAYLQDALHDEDPRVFITALSQCFRVSDVTAVAQKAGLSRESLHRVLNGQSVPRWQNC